MCTELENRRVEDVLTAACNGTTGPPDTINTVRLRTVVPTRVVHLPRHSSKHASRQHWDPIAKVLKPVCAVSVQAAAEQRFWEFTGVWGEKYPAIVGQRLGRVRAVPDLRHGDPKGRLLDERDRECERPDPPGGPGRGHFSKEHAALTAPTSP